VGPDSWSFEIDGDDGSWIDSSGNVHDDGETALARRQQSGKKWEHWSDTAYMDRYSYKVQVTPSPWYPYDDPPNDRSEQMMLTESMELDHEQPRDRVPPKYPVAEAR